MDDIAVSVAISCYNFEDYIGECIISILSQNTDFNFEVIIVDDASTDNSANIIHSLISNNPRVKFIQQQTNKGSDATKQLACTLAQGKYIAFLDGDDVAYANKLQTQYDYLENNPDCSCCYHDMAMIDKDSTNLGLSYFEQFYNQQYIPDKAEMAHLVQYGTFLVASSQMFIASAFKENLLPTNLNYIQDFYYHVHTASKGNFGRIMKTLGAYRQHEQSYSGQNAKSNERRLECLQNILMACDYAHSLGCDIEIVNRGKMHFYFAAAIYFAKKNEPELFTNLIKQSSNGDKFFDNRHETLFKLAKQSFEAALSYINSAAFSNNAQGALK
ncbi:glycosyltransferase [Pseudoalteromonas sp. MB47]|uniref:glycosyltransferase n=1 Tax=Pseudoalteromonas sp. MB47 TaxID=2588452 RepID=UPI001408A0A6|nr:glycosyltransferase [Pseudoalteromonas sp. MB47]NHH91315.1 putative glycosyltransferase EpsE [Pseudoalteromonas sp. MB47]